MHKKLLLNIQWIKYYSKTYIFDLKEFFLYITNKKRIKGVVY